MRGVLTGAVLISATLGLALASQVGTNGQVAFAPSSCDASSNPSDASERAGSSNAPTVIRVLHDLAAVRSFWNRTCDSLAKAPAFDPVHQTAVALWTGPAGLPDILIDEVNVVGHQATLVGRLEVPPSPGCWVSTDELWPVALVVVNASFDRATADLRPTPPPNCAAP
jgi:hypothetical protein